MESICTFTAKSDYESYENTKDILAQVTTSSEDKVYLKLGREYSFCIHADFVVETEKDVILLGNGGSANARADLTKFAKIQITNVDTEETTVINPTRVVHLEAGTYKIDYGIWWDGSEGTYTTPAWTFRSCPEVRYIQVDPVGTKMYIHNLFAADCANLTGIMFGNPDQYPETQVFTEPYSHDDVIINDHFSFIYARYSPAFLRKCPKIRNIYVADGVTYFTGCFGRHDSAMGNSSGNGGIAFTNFSDIKTEIYLGKDVKDSELYYDSGGSAHRVQLQFSAQDKIKRCIVSPENPYIEYDPTVHSIISTELGYRSTDSQHTGQAYKQIITGLGYGYPNHCLTIPAGYRIKNGYITYAELPDIHIIDMSEFNDTICSPAYYEIWYWQRYLDGVYFDGFRDMYNVETLILPKDTTLIPSKYCNGFGGLKNLIIPREQAPVVVWSGQWGYWGSRSEVMPCNTSSLTGGTNNQACTMGHAVSVEERNLYVLYNGGENPTEEQATKKATWTNDYDELKDSSWRTDTGEVDDQGNPIYVYERPNIWKYIQMAYDDAPETYKLLWESECKSPCREYTINYKTDAEMTTLINSLLSQ